MKIYVEPRMNIDMLQVEDVITTSDGITGGNAGGNVGGGGNNED